MKRIPLTTVALGVLALGTPALAADLAVKAPPVYDWSGFYISGFGGSSATTTSTMRSAPPALPTSP
jgi:hypothetical protein